MAPSSRLFYTATMLLASMPPLLSARLARPASAPAIVSDRMGLTMGEDSSRHIVVTSLRSGGAADRRGVAVGDRLRSVAGRPVRGLAATRRLFRAPGQCALPLTFERAGISYAARIWQCDRTEAGSRAGAV